MINLKLKSMASFIILASLVCGNAAWAPPKYGVDDGTPKNTTSQRAPGVADDGDRGAVPPVVAAPAPRMGPRISAWVDALNSIRGLSEEEGRTVAAITAAIATMPDDIGTNDVLKMRTTARDALMVKYGAHAGQGFARARTFFNTTDRASNPRLWKRVQYFLELLWTQKNAEENCRGFYQLDAAEEAAKKRADEVAAAKKREEDAARKTAETEAKLRLAMHEFNSRDLIEQEAATAWHKVEKALWKARDVEAAKEHAAKIAAAQKREEDAAARKNLMATEARKRDIMEQEEAAVWVRIGYTWTDYAIQRCRQATIVN